MAEVPVDDETGEVIERHVRPFAEWLITQRDGSLANEMSEALHDLIDAVSILDKGGYLTLKIQVKPGGKAHGTVVLVTDEVTLKAPEADREAAFFFVDTDGNLTRDNPWQQQLPLREVPA